MRGERTIAGLRCSEVIARLDGYVAATLTDDERRAVIAHVSACALCEDFGARYAKTIEGIRKAHASDTLPDDARARLLTRLDRLR